MKTKLYIPKKINVGYQKRTDTYTGKLAYIIYWDDKGVLRKETSWQGWRDEKIDNSEIENVPTEGFVLNKGVGGARESYGWNPRNEYIRVYDPRGFEFEITVANLLFILQECTSTKGKGLEGEFVYSWQGKDLVLLPVTCEEYKSSTKFTSLQGKKITKADMLEGCSYTNKQQKKLIYLGRLPYYYSDYTSNYNRRIIKCKKVHVFIDEDFNESSNYVNYDKYVIETGFTKLAVRNTETPVENYADLLEEYNNSQRGSKPIDFSLTKKVIPSNYDFENGDYLTWFERNKDGSVNSYVLSKSRTYDYREHKYVFNGYEINLNKNYKFNGDGDLTNKYIGNYGNTNEKCYQVEEVLKMEMFDLEIILDNGSKVKIEKYEL